MPVVDQGIQQQQSYSQPLQQKAQPRQQDSNQLFPDSSYTEETESGTGFMIRSRLPNFIKKHVSPHTQVSMPSESDVQKILDEANGLDRRADMGEREALEAAKVHEELRLQAEEMARNTRILEQEANAREQEFLHRREQLRKEEQELERLRSTKHDEVLKHEALRAQAKADALLQQKKFDHAQRLIARHTEGQQSALAQVQRYRLERQEADLLRQRAHILRSKRPVEDWIPTELAPIKVQVTVQPEDIPEARVPTHESVRGASAGSIIGAQLRAGENQLRSEAQKEAQAAPHNIQSVTANKINQGINPKSNLLAEIKEKGSEHSWLSHPQQQHHHQSGLGSQQGGFGSQQGGFGSQRGVFGSQQGSGFPQQLQQQQQGGYGSQQSHGTMV